MQPCYLATSFVRGATAHRRQWATALTGGWTTLRTASDPTSKGREGQGKKRKDNKGR